MMLKTNNFWSLRGHFWEKINHKGTRSNVKWNPFCGKKYNYKNQSHVL